MVQQKQNVNYLLTGTVGILDFWLYQPKAKQHADHVRSEQHKSSMSLLRVEQAKATNAALTTHAPTAKSRLSMDKLLEEWTGKKFDICYVLAKEKLGLPEVSSNP